MTLTADRVGDVFASARTAFDDLQRERDAYKRQAEQAQNKVTELWGIVHAGDSWQDRYLHSLRRWVQDKTKTAVGEVVSVEEYIHDGYQYDGDEADEIRVRIHWRSTDGKEYHSVHYGTLTELIGRLK